MNDCSILVDEHYMSRRLSTSRDDDHVKIVHTKIHANCHLTIHKIVEEVGQKMLTKKISGASHHCKFFAVDSKKCSQISQ